MIVVTVTKEKDAIYDRERGILNNGVDKRRSEKS